MDDLLGTYGPGRFNGVPWWIYELGMGDRGHTHTINGVLLPSVKEQTRLICNHCGGRGHAHYFCKLPITYGSGRDYANWNLPRWKACMRERSRIEDNTRTAALAHAHTKLPEQFDNEPGDTEIAFYAKRHSQPPWSASRSRPRTT
jgi:hypothetical protein